MGIPCPFWGVSLIPGPFRGWGWVCPEGEYFQQVGAPLISQDTVDKRAVHILLERCLVTCVVDVNYEARVKYAVGQGFYMLANGEPN